MTQASTSELLVVKFGGTSLADLARLDGAAALVVGGKQTWSAQVVIVSAMGDTTDLLLEAGQLAEAGERQQLQGLIARLRTDHLLAAASDRGAMEVTTQLIDELTSLLDGIRLVKEQSARTVALLSSFGERLSAVLFSARLCQRGCAAQAIDARELIRTDAQYEGAKVDFALTKQLCEAVLRPLLKGGATSIVPVVTGFIGATKEGIATTLGRSGSDYTATIIGQALGANEVWIYTDVDGILTADPRLVKEARTLAHVSYREAAEMSYFGARVIHPRTILPAMASKIPIRICNTFNPHHPGTVIGETAPGLPRGVKTVTSIEHLALITLDGRGMAGVPGVARRIFEASERAAVSVIMISQASSEQTVSLVVPERGSTRLVEQLEESFAPELQNGSIERISNRREVAVASIIGQGMAGTPGVAGKLFGSLAAVGVNVLAIAQGASELSISLAVDQSNAGRAVRAIHSAFGLTRIVNVVVLGIGRVGQAFCGLLQETRRQMSDKLDLELRLVAVANRKHLLLNDHGLELGQVTEDLRRAPPRPQDDELLALLCKERFTDVVVVDLTADDTTALQRHALELGFHVVTANKRPVAGTQQAFESLLSASRQGGTRYGFETTFGAGLPVLHTLQELVDTGDELRSVTGCLSGTLGFICTRLQDGISLADALDQARSRGYTEPDPREDLSGRDVARKALIIARAAGHALEPAQVELEPLIPGMEAGLEQAISAHGAELSARVVAAKSAGEVLRYVAQIDGSKVRVGLVNVSANSPIGSLRGPDNILVFRTKRYDEYPLVIRGPGAGAEVTAAGVLGDVLKIARR
jgi:aspartokinase/homoserine dehydrogenase 1